MKVQFRITEDEYAAAVRLHAWRRFIASWYSTANLLASSILVVLAGIGLWQHVLSVFALIFIILMMSILVAWNMRIHVPGRARRHYRQYKAIQELMTAELTDAGIRFSNPDGENVLPWSKVLQWRQNDQFILIYPMPVIFYVLPKSIAREGFDIPLLIRSLADHVGPER